MRQLVIAIVVLFTATLARAEKPVFNAAAYLEWTVAFTKDGPAWLPAATTIGVGMTNPISARWSWYTELSVSTPVTAFNPAPRIVSGPCLMVMKDRVFLSIAALYQFNPALDMAPAFHLVGGGLGFLIAITDKFAVGALVGTSVSLGSGSLDPSLTFAPNVSVTF